MNFFFKVGYTPDVLSSATAELCVSLLLAVARRICEGGWCFEQEKQDIVNK